MKFSDVEKLGGIMPEEIVADGRYLAFEYDGDNSGGYHPVETFVINGECFKFVFSKSEQSYEEIVPSYLILIDDNTDVFFRLKEIVSNQVRKADFELRIGSYFITFQATERETFFDEEKLKKSWWTKNGIEKKGLYKVALELFGNELFDLENNKAVYYNPDCNNYYALEFKDGKVINAFDLDISKATKKVKIDDVFDSHILAR